MHFDPSTFAAVVAALIAGSVRGFAGFGSGLIFMPLVSTAFSPKVAAATFLVVDEVLTLPMVASAVRICRWPTVLPASIAAMIASPFGAWLLAHGNPTALRWTISAIVLAMLALIVSGVRYHRDPHVAASFGVGGVAGILGGIAQMSGPAVIAFWMSGREPVEVVRANLVVFFALASLSSFAAYLWYGFFTMESLWLMVVVTVPYALAIFAGARLFSRLGGTAFRPLAYAAIALAAITGMPILDGIIR